MAGKTQTTSSKSLTLSPLKRKADLDPPENVEENEETKKRQKPINPLEELRDADQNLNAGEIKDKPFMSAEEGEEDEEESVISSVDDNEEISDDDDDVERFLSDDSLALMEVGNILSERMRPPDSLKLLSQVKKGENDGDDVSDLDYCVDEEEEDDKEGISDDDDVEKFLSDDSLALMEVGNILSERMRPRDSLKLLSKVKKGENDGDDVSDLDYCVDEGEEAEEDDKEGISDDDDVEKFLSDDSLALMEVGNILSERMRPCDSLKLVSPVKKAKNDGDDVDDCDYCVEEQEEDEEDEETETETEEEHWEVDNDGINDDDDDDDDDVKNFLSDDSLTLMEVDNILLERTRPRDLLKLVSPIKKAKNDCDDVDDRDYCADEQDEEEDEEDEDTEAEIEEEQDDDDKDGNSDVDDDVEKFLSDDSRTLMEVNNILPERIRPRDSLKLVSPIKKAKNDVDDVNDRDYCVDDQESEEDEEMEKEEQKQVDKDGNNNDDDDVENVLSDDSFTLIGVDNILSERTRPSDSLKLLSPIKKAKNDGDDVNDGDDCVDEQEEEDEEDEETETETDTE